MAKVRPPPAHEPKKAAGEEGVLLAKEVSNPRGESHRPHHSGKATQTRSAKGERAAAPSELPKESRARAPGDDFEPSQTFGSALGAEPLIPPSVPGGKPRSGVLELLDEAEAPGVFFREREGNGQAGDEEDSELDLAVEEAIQLLFGVRGIHHIGPGEDVEGNPVVLISANTGFGQSSLDRIPPTVRGFKTLLALPYELLPLRRDRI